jgi:antitoxin MazE
MQTVIGKWGNSLAVRIPQNAVNELSIKEGTAVTVSVDNGALVLKRSRIQYSLDDLLRDHVPEHNQKETDWGKPFGKETW